MATIETATFDGFQEEHINISFPVGMGEKNERNDLIAVQALFKLVGNSELRSELFFGMATRELPEITGQFDQSTNRAILAFQRKMSSRLLSVDGKIHPASYRNRVLQRAYKGARLMAITLLNIESVIQAAWIGRGSVPEAVKVIAPTIKFA